MYSDLQFEAKNYMRDQKTPTDWELISHTTFMQALHKNPFNQYAIKTKCRLFTRDLNIIPLRLAIHHKQIHMLYTNIIKYI